MNGYKSSAHVFCCGSFAIAQLRRSVRRAPSCCSGVLTAVTQSPEGLLPPLCARLGTHDAALTQIPRPSEAWSPGFVFAEARRRARGGLCTSSRNDMYPLPRRLSERVTWSCPGPEAAWIPHQPLPCRRWPEASVCGISSVTAVNTVLTSVMKPCFYLWSGLHMYGTSGRITRRYSREAIVTHK